MGHGRHIPLQRKNGVKIHRSVEIRMAAQGLENGTYAPQGESQSRAYMGGLAQ
jgi:hypothetical protein